MATLQSGSQDQGFTDCYWYYYLICIYSSTQIFTCPNATTLRFHFCILLYLFCSLWCLQIVDRCSHRVRSSDVEVLLSFSLLKMTLKVLWMFLGLQIEATKKESCTWRPAYGTIQSQNPLMELCGNPPEDFHHWTHLFGWHFKCTLVVKEFSQKNVWHIGRTELQIVSHVHLRKEACKDDSLRSKYWFPYFIPSFVWAFLWGSIYKPSPAQSGSFLKWKWLFPCIWPS